MEKTIPLATDDHIRFDHDYADVINLLCQIAELGGEPIKKHIADALYPNDGSSINTILIQVAQLLGKKPGEGDSIQKWATLTAADIRLQVQRLAPNQEPVAVKGGFGTFSFASQEGTIQVAINSHSNSLDALIQYRHILNDDNLRNLVKAILDIATDQDNILSNRVNLLLSLAKLTADCISEDMIQNVCNRVYGIAMGMVLVSDAVSPDVNDPLNPFKISMGSVDDVRGAALYTYSCLVKAKPEKQKIDAVNYCLERALTDSCDTVRRMGLI